MGWFDTVVTAQEVGITEALVLVPALGFAEVDKDDVVAADGGVMDWLVLRASERALGVLWAPRTSSRSKAAPSPCHSPQKRINHDKNRLGFSWMSRRRRLVIITKKD